MNDHPEMTALAMTFFVCFAWFEYALKQFPEFRKDEQSGVKPNWDSFSRAPEIVGLFNVMSTDAAIRYLIDNPPKKRVVSDDSLSWKVCKKPENMTDLLIAVRRVRNNLFHGDKPNPDISRDENLFNAAIAVLDRLLASHKGVRDAYWDGLDMA